MSTAPGARQLAFWVTPPDQQTRPGESAIVTGDYVCGVQVRVLDHYWPLASKEKDGGPQPPSLTLSAPSKRQWRVTGIRLLARD